MGMRVHELHAAVVHAPLVLLPMAAASDLQASLTGRKRVNPTGRALWLATAGSGLLAGIAGLAASREVDARQNGERLMWLHGIGNAVLISGAIGIALWRRRNPANVGLAFAGLAATALSFGTAYLGGEMVYGHGVGVRRLPDGTKGHSDSPPLLSLRALPVLLRDAWRGLQWLFGSAPRFASKQERAELPRALQD